MILIKIKRYSKWRKYFTKSKLNIESKEEISQEISITLKGYVLIRERRLKNQ
jgi:hypothetical protein